MSKFLTCPYCRRELPPLTSPFLSPLSARDILVLSTILGGDYTSYKEASDHLGIQYSTVKQILKRSLRRFGMRNLIELANYWHCELFQIGAKELGIL